MIKVLFFASIRERLDQESEQMDLQDLSNVTSLLYRLRERGGIWGQVFSEDQTVMIAVNQEMAGEETELSDGDEVAFFPPVTGG